MPRSSSDRSRRALRKTRLGAAQCARGGAKTRLTCALVKREGIRQRQYVNWLGNDLLSIRALGISKHPVTGLEGAPERRDRDGAGKLGAKHKRARRLRLILSLGLQYLFLRMNMRRHVSLGKYNRAESVRHTSKKLSPALCTLIRSSSEPGVGTGTGASRVSGILDGWAYSEMTSAFINGSEITCVRQYATEVVYVEVLERRLSSCPGHRGDFLASRQEGFNY